MPLSNQARVVKLQGKHLVQFSLFHIWRWELERIHSEIECKSVLVFLSFVIMVGNMSTFYFYCIISLVQIIEGTILIMKIPKEIVLKTESFLSPIISRLIPFHLIKLVLNWSLQVYKSYPSYDLSDRKEFIKKTVKEVNTWSMRYHILNFSYMSCFSKIGLVNKF